MLHGIGWRSEMVSANPAFACASDWIIAGKPFEMLVHPWLSPRHWKGNGEANGNRPDLVRIAVV